MRIPFFAATLIAISGCVGDGGDIDALAINAVGDDAHCRDLLMQPGELVYAQCRLALRRTYLDDYGTRKAAIEQRYGSVPDGVDRALRADTFCNYDESVKASVETIDADRAAQLAYGNCDTTRAELDDEFRSAFGPEAAISSDQQELVIGQNRRSVEDARIAIKGPGAEPA